MVSILSENGGVAVIDPIAITEPLTWLNDFSTLNTFSHESKGSPPQVISFYDNYYSSGKVKI
jgi:hypothetical protein